MHAHHGRGVRKVLRQKKVKHKGAVGVRGVLAGKHEHAEEVWPRFVDGDVHAALPVDRQLALEAHDGLGDVADARARACAAHFHARSLVPAQRRR
jgi:hypothetical protein